MIESAKLLIIALIVLVGSWDARAAVWVGDRCFADLTKANDWYFANQPDKLLTVPIPNTPASQHPTKYRLIKTFQRRESNGTWSSCVRNQSWSAASDMAGDSAFLGAMAVWSSGFYGDTQTTCATGTSVLYRGVGYEVAGECPATPSGSGSSSDMSADIWGFPTRQSMADVFSWFFLTPLVLYLVAWCIGLFVRQFNDRR